MRGEQVTGPNVVSDDAMEQAREELKQRMTDIGVRLIDATGPAVRMELTFAQEMLAMFATACDAFLDHSGAENYVEIYFRDPRHPDVPVSMVVQRAYKKTPHQKRVEAEQERDAALAELATLRAHFAAQAATIASAANAPAVPLAHTAAPDAPGVGAGEASEVPQ